MISQSTHAPRRAATAILASIVLAVTAACTTTVPGVPRAEGDQPGQTVSEDLPPVAQGSDDPAVLAQVRAIDPCALHSIEAAQQASGMKGDSIMPDKTPNACELNLVPSADTQLSAWDLTVTVDLAHKAKPASASPQQLGDITATKQATTSGDESRDCSYVMTLPAQPGPAGTTPPSSAASPATTVDITLRAYKLSKEQPKPACDVAQEYLRGASKVWKAPALRTDKVTKPALVTAQLNPCSGLNRMTATLGGPIEATFPDAHSCEIRRATTPGAGAPKTSGGKVTVKYLMDADPRKLVALNGKTPLGNYEPLTVAGRPGVVNKPTADPAANPKAKLPGANPCTVTVLVDEQTALQKSKGRSDAAKTFPVMEAKADTCETATAAIEAAQPGRPAPPAKPAPGADQRLAGRAPESLTLGDLNPPPSAADVGAPYDPCALGWQAFPEGVRDPKNRAPELLEPPKEQKFDVICSYQVTGDITVSIQPGAPPSSTSPEGGQMIADVVWQQEPGGDPNGKTNADGTPVEAVDWAPGKRGYVRDSGIDPKLGPSCVAAVQLGPKGTGAVYVWNKRFPQHSACAIARSVGAAIAAASK